MRCLVLGGAGFIGSHVIDRLTQAGHEVRLLDRRPNPYWSPPAGVECFWADWGDPRAIDRALARVDVVVHLISTTVPATAGRDLAAELRADLEPTLGLLDAARGRVRRVVFASSGGTVYGRAERLPIPEDHPTWPLSAHGVVKLTIEKYLHLYHHQSGLEYIILRSANPYGERQDPRRPQGAVGVFLGRLARDEAIEIAGDGSVVRDYFHVGDLAEAYRLAVETPLAAETFNVGSGQGLSLLELLEVVRRITKHTPSVVHRPARPQDVPANVLDTARLQSRLGWSPTVSLEDGLARTWAWIREQVQ